MKHPIPDNALDDRLFFGGTAGSGKTYNAMGRVERLLAKGARVVIPDPLGVWWGLRLLADGKTASGYDVVIFGGPHGDLPLTEHSAALIGETVAGMKESCILDLSQLGSKAAERRFMLAFLTTLYKHTTGEPLHVIFDEADMWSPQRLLDKDGDAAKLLGMMETIVRRGRVKGFIPWLISQRPAVISKDVLSQVDGLIAFKLTSSQDRDAIGDWVEGQADKAQWREIWSSLPTMHRGEGVVWIPGRGILDTVQFPEKETFDSSRTPKRGEILKRATALKPLDLSQLKDRLAKVEADTKANDPKALRAQIAQLMQIVDPPICRRQFPDGHVPGNVKEAAEGWKQWADIYRDKCSAGADLEDLKKAEEKGFAQAEKKLRNVMKRELNKRLKEGLASMRKHAVDALSHIDDELREISADDAVLAVEFTAPEMSAMHKGFLSQRASVAPKAPPQVKSAPPNADERPLGAERKPLAVLASIYPAGMTEGQWAVGAGLKRSGGTWSTYVSRLRSAGRISEANGMFYASDQGMADIGQNFEPMPLPGPDLVQYWMGKINGVRPMLTVLAGRYPDWISREDLGEAINVAPSGGTFSTYLSRLRGPGLIETEGQNVRAAPSLMGGE